MNVGNHIRRYRLWLDSLRILKSKTFDNGVSFELKDGREQGLVVVRYEDGLYDSSIMQKDYSEQEFNDILVDIGF